MSLESEYSFSKLNSKDQLKRKLEAPIHRASEILLNLAVYQIGEKETLSYKEILEIINGRFSISSSSEPLLSKHWYKELPVHIKDKDIVTPILAYGILRPDNGQFSKNNYFGGMLHVIRNNKTDLDSNFYLPLSCKSHCSAITSHWSSRLDIHKELKSWLESQDIANIAIKIDSARDNNDATQEVCEALELLNIDNPYIDCINWE